MVSKVKKSNRKDRGKRLDRSKNEAKDSSSGSLTEDPRFSSLMKDPRFNKLSRKNVKVAIDDRFQGMLKNGKEFGLDKAPVDKFGRPKSTLPTAEEGSLGRYYKLDAEFASLSSASSSEDEADEKPEAKAKVDRARGIGVLADSSDDDASSETSLDEGNAEDRLAEAIEDDEDDVWDLHNQDVPTGDMTHRVAAVNMDWDHIKAIDIYKVFENFIPAGGKLLSVKIYRSEFGKERMERELVEGPAKEAFTKFNKNKKSSLIVEEAEEDDIDQTALRRYELERLRYYYAIAVFDSVATARAVYTACDRSEFETSSNFFDLRFVPDGEEFSDSDVAMVADCSPVTYNANSFQTLAMQHSKINLTWDSDEPERVKLMQRKIKPEDLKEMDYKAYVASDSESASDEDHLENSKKYLERDREYLNSDGSEESPEQIREKYRALLKDSMVEPKGNRASQVTKNSDEERDLEVTFASGLADGEAAVSESESGVSDNEKEASEELLELLLDTNGEQDFDMKRVLKIEKAQGKNNKYAKRKLRKLGLEGAKDDFELDTEDKRFTELYSDHNYAVDPTNPNFKKTRNMKKILATRSKRQRGV